MRAAVAAVAALLLVAACGGASAEERARNAYGEYRTSEDERAFLEKRFREAFAEIGRAADAGDREGAVAAVARAQETATEIDRLIESELVAAARLGEHAPTAADAGRLGHGLGRTQAGLRLLQQVLAIALGDPFLDRAPNASEVSDLSRRSATFAREGELEIRRADRGLALTLGITPRPDPIFDGGETTG